MQEASNETGMLWHIGDAGSGPRGGQQYGRPAFTATATLGMLGLILDDMEREVRREISRAEKSECRVTFEEIIGPFPDRGIYVSVGDPRLPWTEFIAG